MVLTAGSNSVVHGKLYKELMGTHQCPGSTDGNTLRGCFCWYETWGPLPSLLRMGLLKSPEISLFHVHFFTHLSTSFKRNNQLSEVLCITFHWKLAPDNFHWKFYRITNWKSFKLLEFSCSFPQKRLTLKTLLDLLTIEPEIKIFKSEYTCHSTSYECTLKAMPSSPL